MPDEPTLPAPPGLPTSAGTPIDASGRAKLSFKVPRRLEARLRAYQQAVFERYDTRLVRNALYREAIARLLDDATRLADVLDRRAEAGRPREPLTPLTTDLPGELYREMVLAVTRDGRRLPYSTIFVAAVDSYLAELEAALDAALEAAAD